MFIDTHCHLSADDYDDIDDVILNNRKNNVNKIIVSGCDEKSILEVIELADKYDDIYLTLGYHPSEVDKVNDRLLKLLEKQLMTVPKVVGLGEIGLDYYYGKNNRDKQLELFEKQMLIAEKLKLKVVIHSRDATEDTINMLKKYNVTGIIHCFSGSIETAMLYVSMGFKLGIGGVVTFKNSNLFKVVEAVGLANIVLETDSPYLAPAPYRGTKNSSKNIPVIAERIAEICGVSIDEVGRVTTSTVCNLFDLD